MCVEELVKDNNKLKEDTAIWLGNCDRYKKLMDTNKNKWRKADRDFIVQHEKELEGKSQEYIEKGPIINFTPQIGIPRVKSTFEKAYSSPMNNYIKH
jgi:hypothetical protein